MKSGDADLCSSAQTLVEEALVERSWGEVKPEVSGLQSRGRERFTWPLLSKQLRFTYFGYVNSHQGIQVC